MTDMPATRVRALEQLCLSAAQCRCCAGMGCAPVLSAANGTPDAKVLFIGEAPGRLGAGVTGVPFSGDEAGRRFERLLAVAGLRREAVFVTNAVLCLPLDGRGRNRAPRLAEVKACSGWLSRTIALVQPELAVAMGHTALDSTRLLAPHELSLANAGDAPTSWDGRRLAVVYHPGARSQVHRRWEQQARDWAALGDWWRANGLADGMLRA
jgi:uracil-DNA glycosylase family 4